MPSVVLKRPRFFSPIRNAAVGTTMLRSSAAIKMNFVIVDIVISSLIVCDYELTNIKYFISVILLLNVNQRIF